MKQFIIDEYIAHIIRRHFAYPSAPVKVTSDKKILKYFLQNNKLPITVRVCFNNEDKIDNVKALLGTKIENNENRQYGVYLDDEIIKQFPDQLRSITRKFYISSDADKIDMMTYMNIEDYKYLIDVSSLLKGEGKWMYNALIIDSSKSIEQQLQKLRLEDLIVSQIEAELLIENM